MDRNSIGVCCIRDPRDPAVWSRTPRNICDVLEARGRLGPAFWGLPHAGLPMKLEAAAAALLYGRPRLVREFVHGRRMRAKHAQAIATQMRGSGVRSVLHFAGTRYLPLPAGLESVKQYLLVDSTWEYWDNSHLPRRYCEVVEQDLRRGYEQMTHIFAIAEHARESLIQRYGIAPDRVTTVGSGRGVIKPYEGQKDFSNGKILFVAKGLLRRKGGDLVLDGFRIAHAKNPKLQLVLVGDEELRARAGDQPGVEFHGFLPLEALQQLFEQASLFAMPARREPWGLVYLEALSCQTPVLGLKRGALPEITKDGAFGFMADKESAESVAREMLRAFEDPAALARMGHAAKEHVVSHFTWEQTVDRILERIDAAEGRGERMTG